MEGNKIDWVPMIMIEGVDERVNNQKLRDVYKHLKPARCRVVYRNGRCLRKAGIEFTTEELAKEAVLFSRNLSIEGNTIRNARLATQNDRDWFRKPSVKKRNKKERPKVTKKKEILSKILYDNENNDPEPPMPNIVIPKKEFNTNSTLLNMSKEEFYRSSFVIVAVERMVNCTIGASSNLVFPYEIAMVKFTISELEMGKFTSFHRIIDINYLPPSLTPSYVWCNKNEGAPSFHSVLGERDLLRLKNDITGFIVEDNAILLAKTPSVVNVSLHNIFEQAGQQTPIPFMPAQPIEDFIDHSFMLKGSSRTTSFTHNMLSQPTEERIKSSQSRCAYHLAQKSIHCALATCTFEHLICTHVVNNSAI